MDGGELNYVAVVGKLRVCDETAWQEWGNNETMTKPQRNRVAVVGK